MSTLPNQFLNEMISDQLNAQTKEFFRPKTTIERLQLILSIIWFLFAFLGSLEIQAFIFLIVIALIIFNRINLLQEESSPFLSDILRFSIYFFLFIFFLRPQVEKEVILLGFTINDIILLQKYILASLIVIGVFLRNVRLELLKPTRSNMLTNYLDFSFQIIKGISSGIYLYIIFELFYWAQPTAQSSDIFPNNQDLLLLLASLFVLISSQGPQGKDLKKLMVSELLLASETRFERARDALFKISLIIIAFIYLIPIFSADNNTLISAEKWNDVATFIFVIALITFMLAFMEQSPNKTNFGNYSNLFSEKASTIIPDKFNYIQESIQDATVDPEINQYFKLNEDFIIINKEKTKYVAKKNSIAIPVKETPDGVAVVFVGENELTNIEDSSSSIPTVEKIDESATAVMIPNDAWQSAYSKLEVIKPSDEVITRLELKGIETKEKLVSLAENALNDFKIMTLPKNLANRVQGIANDFQRGKYFISDTKKGTHIRLPGITVIENSDYTFVRVFGIKVLDAKGSSIVSLPFLKVIDTPDYDFVSLPGLKVIDAHGSSLVNIAGFQITDGDQSQIEEATKKIASDTQKLGQAFNQIENQVGNILESPEQLLITKTLSGKKLELLSGTTSDRALISGNLSSITSLKTSKRKKKKHARKERKEKRRVKASGSVSISVKSSFKLVKDTKQKIEKLGKIISISQSSLGLKRLKRQLDFSTLENLEDWLISLNLESLQINWDENKLIISEDLKKEISKINEES